MANNSISIPERGFLRLKQVLQLVPVGKTKWHAGVKSGEFPKPCKVGRCSLYKASDILKLIESIEKNANGNSAN